MIDSLLESGKRRPLFLFDQITTVTVATQDLLFADPELSSLMNLNQPDDYLAALQRAGLQPDPNTIAQFDLLGDSSG